MDGLQQKFDEQEGRYEATFQRLMEENSQVREKFKRQGSEMDEV